MGSRMPFPLAGGETAFANPPQTAADALATTTETTNQKQSKTMKVKIKGISELESAKYVCLSASVFPQNCKNLRFSQCEIYMIIRLDRTKTLGNISKFKCIVFSHYRFLL